MRPKEIVLQWVDAFNSCDIEMITELYADYAVNHQVANKPVVGIVAIKEMFEQDFTQARRVCIIANIFEDGQWAIIEWRGPSGFRGCGFFQVINDKIVLQRGYWDKMTLMKLDNSSID